MPNTILTHVEFMDEIVAPALDALKADDKEARAEARVAFARGEKSYRTTVFGVEVVYTPENVDA